MSWVGQGWALVWYAERRRILGPDYANAEAQAWQAGPGYDGASSSSHG